MPALLNTRHERFAQELANGKSALEAHKLAGYRPDKGTASRLQHGVNISQRVTELLEIRDQMATEATRMATEALGIDRTWVLAQLKENAQRAMQAVPLGKRDDFGLPISGEWTYEGSVANRALELLGKEIGMFVDRTKSTTEHKGGIYIGKEFDGV